MRIINRSHRRKAFTLVELVVVILIVAVLATMVFLGGATVINQSRKAKVQSDLSSYSNYVQDMMYSCPELQFNENYKAERITYDSGFKYYLDNVDVTGNSSEIAKMYAYETLCNNFLTDDFQLAKDGSQKDAWDNSYLYSYAHLKASASGENAHCAANSYAVIVISTMGANSIDEANREGTSLASDIIASIQTDANNYANTYTSASDIASACKSKLGATVVAGSAEAQYATGDDYGAIIFMCNGEVSTSFFNLD